MKHEATTIHTVIEPRRTANSYRRVALARCLYDETMPNTARLLQRPTPLRNCSQSGLRLPDGTQCYQSLRYGRAELPQSRVTPSQDCAADHRPGESRTIA